MKPSVSVWTTSQLDFDQRIQRIISTIESVGLTVSVWDRKTSNYHGGRIESRYTRGPGMYLDYNWQIARNVRKHKTCLIYAADIDVMPGLMYGLWRRREVPLLLDLHEWFPEVIELQNQPFKQAIWRLVERRSVAFASSHITVNQSLKDIFEQRYKKEFTVLRNVPELKSDIQVSPDKRLENKILYYQGALNEGRGLETAVETLRLLPGWRLWLIGEGDVLDEIKDKVEDKIKDMVKDKAKAEDKDEDEVEDKVKVKVEDEVSVLSGSVKVGNVNQKFKGLEDRIVFFGRKKPDELRELAGQATVGLNLLDGQSRSYYYSLANRYFDYAHAGLPAIHMNYPEYQKLMNEYKVGSLIDELSPESLANVIMQITNDKQLYNRLITQCSLAKLKYNWQEESKVLFELLESFDL